MSLENYPLSKHIQNNSPLAFGCMGLGGEWGADPITKQNIKQAHDVVDAALAAGITLFDHADIYTLGKAEKVFGEVLKQRPELRQQMAIQSKCAIRFDDEFGPKRYDFSADWIVQSVENSLSRLNIEQLDVLMLHRPDPLMEPESVAAAFDQLHSAGKVKHFGVSNMQQQQMAFLQAHLQQPLMVNQVELSLSHLAWLEEGVTSGNSGQPAVNYGAGTIEYCRQTGVQLQSWGSLCQGLYSGKQVANASKAVQQTSQLVAKLAAEYQVSTEAIVLAWVMRHPAHIQPIIGTTNIQRIQACAQATQVTLTRGHWYALWVAARGNELP
ncbi:aldo/keto reductase [Paraglaciecola psychrophila]|uniref:Aldo/keto reductase n=1 Tax=Paraglaciecola psychrophila 170 TaxID=1129794 RepID=K7ATF5_9ALTE|nr:aldo/keto reductase [Paraglaciecola psychrophila]AGH46769.1 aldo/keto reductase [Paraglaciecola psychrophila 170]GAC38525.1 oxidoreductase ydhF [Paraglaciecola psychrophila 170]